MCSNYSLWNLSVLTAPFPKLVSTEVGIAKSTKEFSAAAGILQSVRDDVLKVSETSPSSYAGLPLDVTPSGLTMLVNLMLAQGQVGVSTIPTHYNELCARLLHVGYMFPTIVFALIAGVLLQTCARYK